LLMNASVSYVSIRVGSYVFQDSYTILV
jgi:hypothetical protein